MADIRYCWALSDSDRFQGNCASREEAVEEARVWLSDVGEGPDSTATVYTGEAHEVLPSGLLRILDVEWLLENLDEALSEETGAEWLVFDYQKYDTASLHKAMGQLLDEWARDAGIPRQYRVERLRGHTVTLDPVEGEGDE